MFALCYSSIFITGYGTADLESIREESQAYNSGSHITGRLFFHNNEFVEINQGSKRAVLRLFAKTRADPRHRDLRLLWGWAHERRYFDGWGMGFFEPFGDVTDVPVERRFKRDMLSSLTYRTGPPLPYMLFGPLYAGC